MNLYFDKLIKTFQCGIDIGSIFWANMHDNTSMLSRYNNDDLRLLAPSYFIKILQQNLCTKYYMPPVDTDGLFRFMGIEMREGYENKIILYHKDYTLFAEPDIYYEFDLSIFSQTINQKQ